MSKVDEKDYELAFKITIIAGDSRSYAMNAIDAAREYDFEKYEDLMKKAEEQFINCHAIQKDMLGKEASGEKADVNIFLIHAQDHLTMASMAIENAKIFRDLFKQIKDLKENIK